MHAATLDSNQVPAAHVVRLHFMCPSAKKRRGLPGGVPLSHTVSHLEENPRQMAGVSASNVGVMLVMWRPVSGIATL